MKMLLSKVNKEIIFSQFAKFVDTLHRKKNTMWHTYWSKVHYCTTSNNTLNWKWWVHNWFWWYLCKDTIVSFYIVILTKTYTGKISTGLSGRNLIKMKLHKVVNVKRLWLQLMISHNRRLGHTQPGFFLYIFRKLYALILGIFLYDKCSILSKIGGFFLSREKHLFYPYWR